MLAAGFGLADRFLQRDTPSPPPWRTLARIPFLFVPTNASGLSLAFVLPRFSLSAVDSELPKVTVLIAARPGQTEVKAVIAARSLDYPPDKLEIILARGRQPSVQRNAGIRDAQGSLIYFLDDDSEPAKENLRRAVERFHDPKVEMVGGPNICPSDAPRLEKVFSTVLGCWLAFGPSRARYVPVGQPRPSGEKELILCNLLARRTSLLELGGFNEALYPNEENALMDELQKRGGHLWYDPQFIVQRRPRATLRAFIKMLMTYGRGRAEQFRLHPTPGSILNFVPPLFCVYLITLLLTPLIGLWWLLPLAGYAAAVLLQTVLMVLQGSGFNGLLASPLIVATHVLYGIGFWRGITTTLKPRDQRAPVPVELERITLGA